MDRQKKQQKNNTYYLERAQFYHSRDSAGSLLLLFPHILYTCCQSVRLILDLQSCNSIT